MLEEKIDKAAEAIKRGIGKIRENKNKLIIGGAGLAGGLGAVALAFKAGKSLGEPEYECDCEEEFDYEDIDEDEVEPDIIEVTTVEIEETED